MYKSCSFHVIFIENALSTEKIYNLFFCENLNFKENIIISKGKFN